jgi:predicted esterase
MTAEDFPGVTLTVLPTMSTGSRPMPMMCGTRPSHLTDQPAIVIGLSSGAIVTLEVLIQYSEQIQTVVAHEPPVVSLLHDAAKWWAFFDRIYDSSRKNGIPKAMHQFVSMVVGKEEHQVIERAMTVLANEYTRANAA